VPSSSVKQDERIQQAIKDFGLEGRKLYLPQMPYGGSYLLAAAIRSIGFDAWPTSDSDERTLDLGGRMTSGDECYPQKITLGDFLRIIEEEGRENVAFLMPTANGPCRFGQYLHLVKAKFRELGYDDVPVISITSNDGYSSIGNYSQDLVRTAWRASCAPAPCTSTSTTRTTSPCPSAATSRAATAATSRCTPSTNTPS